MQDPIVDGEAITNVQLGGFARRAFLRGQGRGHELSRRRPVIGICTSWSELNPCNVGLRDLAEAVKRGVVAAGGQALEFPTISVGEQFTFPTSMILRNLMAMDVEEMIRRSPIDAVVLLAGCDKTVPAQLMGAASAGRPAIMVTAGPRPTGRFRSEPVVTDDFWTLAVERQTGAIDDEGWHELEGALCPGVGVCNVLGTATTMAMIAEALGMAPPGSALVNATDARRAEVAEHAGVRIVEMARQGVTPNTLMTASAFENALRLLVAIGGSTNAVIHLEAIAGRLGLRLGLDTLADVSATTPLLTSVKPSGPHHLDDLQDAGGTPAVLWELRSLLDLSAPTAAGPSWDEMLPTVPRREAPCLRPMDDPFLPAGGISVVRGNLAPDGAIIKRAAAREDLWTHEGPAMVYEGAADATRRSFDPSTDCADDAVLVVRGAGPLGGPGMPELGQIPIPVSLRRRGVTDMVCLTDARVSGTQKGATVLHAAPESQLGGALSVVEDGDMIRLDAREGTIDLLLDDAEIDARLGRRVGTDSVPARGYERLFHLHVQQAPDGCDFDFLRAHAPDGSTPT